MHQLSGLFILVFSITFGGSALAYDLKTMAPIYERYYCTLNADKTKGWIPNEIELVFNDDQQLTNIQSSSFKVDLKSVKVIRYTEDFREVKYQATYKGVKGGAYKTIHTITILPKHDNKISYMMKFGHYRNHHMATGTCKKR